MGKVICEFSRFEDYHLDIMLGQLKQWVDENQEVIVYDILVTFDTDYQTWRATVYHTEIER